MEERYYDPRQPGKFNFRLRDACFSRKLSWISIGEAREPDRHLYVARFVKRHKASVEPSVAPCPAVIDLRLTEDGAPAEYTETVEPTLLTAQTERGGLLEVCFDTPELLRIRVRNAGLLLSGSLRPQNTVVAYAANAYVFSFGDVGEFVLYGLKGSTRLTATRGAEGTFAVQALPAANGELELCLHFARSSAKAAAQYRPFEDCVREAQQDYEAWYALYPSVSPEYEYIKRISVYGIWMCYVAPGGTLRDHAILFQRNDCAFSWHSAYNAMAITRDADLAVHMLLTAFSYQDEYGELPDLFDDSHYDILATKPPFHGAAALWLLEGYGDTLTRAHCERLYPPLERWCRWWLTYRDTDHNGVPQYNQGCESGMDTTRMLQLGTPAECPDLIAYIILLEEVLGKLAQRLGRTEDAQRWMKLSQSLTDTLVREFWAGDRFVARLSTSHRPAVADGLESYAPIVLGHRLPKDILDSLEDRLTRCMTEYGLAPLAEDGSAFTFVDGFDQLKCAIGLYDAGRVALAERVMRAYCNANLRFLPSFGYMVGGPPEDPGIQGAAFFMDYGKCSSLGGCIFLTLAGLLWHMQAENKETEGTARI